MEAAKSHDENEEMQVSMAVALKQLQDSVASQGLVDASAFHEACQHHASIVARESNPLWFLKFEKDDIAAAARRLVSYWQERKQAFGERAFLPMTLSSPHGQHDDDSVSALSPQDVQTLKAGHWLHLPRDHYDRTVLCHDLSKQPQSISTSYDDDEAESDDVGSLSFVRIIFFMLQIALENEASRSSDEAGGFVLLVNVSNPFAACFDEAFEKTISRFMNQAMPLKISHVHLVCHYPSPSFSNNDTDQKAFVQSTLGVAQKRLGSLLDESMSMQIVAHSNQECLEKLVALGLTKEGLPACFGGSFSSTKWEPWRRYCQEGAMIVHEETLELEVNLPCLVRNALWTYTTTRTQSADATADGCQSLDQYGNKVIVSSGDAIPPTTENKKRIATKKPKVQGPSNSDPNKKRKAIVKNPTSTGTRTQVEEDEDPRVKKRRMDAVYAQRKREKLRIETEVLEGQCQDASAVNTSLLAENQRLEGLVHAAKQLADLYETSSILNASASAPSFGGAAAAAAAAYPAAWPQPYLPLHHQDFRMHAASFGSLPSPQQQLLLAQQQNAYGFAPSGGMLH